MGFRKRTKGYTKESVDSNNLLPCPPKIDESYRDALIVGAECRSQCSLHQES
jgi:hypothetical protein